MNLTMAVLGDFIARGLEIIRANTPGAALATDPCWDRDGQLSDTVTDVCLGRRRRLRFTEAEARRRLFVAEAVLGEIFGDGDVGRHWQTTPGGSPEEVWSVYDFQLAAAARLGISREELAAIQEGFCGSLPHRGGYYELGRALAG